MKIKIVIGMPNIKKLISLLIMKLLKVWSVIHWLIKFLFVF